MKVKGHKLHVRSKIKKNEENRGLINKKAYEDQFSFGALILFSHRLSYYWTLSFLEHSWRSVAYLVFGARRQRKSKKA